MADQLTRREAKRLALAEAAALLRTRLDDAPAEVLADALLVGATDDTPGIDDLDVDQAARALAAALDEVAAETQRRADRYLQDVTPRKARTLDVDELLCRLTDLGVDTDTVIRSRARRFRHGWHAITWTHPDGYHETAEGSTAGIAAGKALRSTEKRIRNNERRQRRGQAA